MAPQADVNMLASTKPLFDEKQMQRQGDEAEVDVAAAAAATTTENSKKRKRGRPKGSKTSCHPLLTRPSRPKTAYNLFFSDQKKLMVEERQAKLNKKEQKETANNLLYLANSSETQQQQQQPPSSTEDQQDQQSSPDVKQQKRGRGRPRGPNFPSNQRKKSTGVGYKFADLARIIAGRWKDIDQKTKHKYEVLAKQEFNKYQDAMDRYNIDLERITQMEKRQKDQEQQQQLMQQQQAVKQDATAQPFQEQVLRAQQQAQQQLLLMQQQLQQDKPSIMVPEDSIKEKVADKPKRKEINAAVPGSNKKIDIEEAKAKEAELHKLMIRDIMLGNVSSSESGSSGTGSTQISTSTANRATTSGKTTGGRHEASQYHQGSSVVPPSSSETRRNQLGLNTTTTALSSMFGGGSGSIGIESLDLHRHLNGGSVLDTGILARQQQQIQQLMNYSASSLRSSSYLAAMSGNNEKVAAEAAIAAAMTQGIASRQVMLPSLAAIGDNGDQQEEQRLKKVSKIHENDDAKLSIARRIQEMMDNKAQQNPLGLMMSHQSAMTLLQQKQQQQQQQYQNLMQAQISNFGENKDLQALRNAAILEQSLKTKTQTAGSCSFSKSTCDRTINHAGLPQFKTHNSIDFSFSYNKESEKESSGIPTTSYNCNRSMSQRGGRCSGGSKVPYKKRFGSYKN